MIFLRMLGFGLPGHHLTITDIDQIGVVFPLEIAHQGIMSEWSVPYVIYNSGINILKLDIESTQYVIVNKKYINL